jgi:hypothetical protein
MARPDSAAVGLLADSGGFKMPLPASDQYYCHSQVATFNLCKTRYCACETNVQNCNPTTAQFRPGLALLHLPATILIDSGAMVYTTTKRPCNVKQKAGVPWTGLPTLPSPPIPYPAFPAWVAGGPLKCIVLSSLPSSLPWECRARGRPGQACRRVEVVVCRRGGCAVQDEPGSRRSYCHAKATIQCKQL